MAGRLLTSLDQTLRQGALRNAEAAVRADARHAEQRREAARALAISLPTLQRSRAR